jgi:hypothetical protein
VNVDVPLNIRNCQTGFQSNITILTFYQQCMKVVAALHPQQHLVRQVSLCFQVMLLDITVAFVVFTLP